MRNRDHRTKEREEGKGEKGARLCSSSFPLFSTLALPRFAPRTAGTPCVVAIEGPNGAGKTTLCAALVGPLRARSCLGIDPAWFSPEFKTRMIRDAEWFASAMFFLSGCFEQMRALRSSKA